MDREVRPLRRAARGGAEREANVERAAAGRELGALEVGANRERRARRRVHRRGVAGADVAHDLALGRGEDAARDGRLEGGEVTAAGAIRGGEAAVGVDRDERRSGRGRGLRVAGGAAFPAGKRLGARRRSAFRGAGAVDRGRLGRRRHRRGRRESRCRCGDRRGRPLVLLLRGSLGHAARRGEPPSDRDRHPHMPSRLHVSPRHPLRSIGFAARTLGRVSFASDLGGSNRASKGRRRREIDLYRGPVPAASNACGARSLQVEASTSRRRAAVAETISFEKELLMASARNVSRSIRRWSSLWALPFLAALALAACGGKVVVDADTGEGGAGGTSVTSASVTPSTGVVGPSTCDAAIAHLDSCIPGGVGEVPPLPSCDGQFLCQMTCILVTSCEGLVGTDPASAQQFSNCLDACGLSGRSLAASRDSRYIGDMPPAADTGTTTGFKPSFARWSRRVRGAARARARAHGRGGRPARSARAATAAAWKTRQRAAPSRRRGGRRARRGGGLRGRAAAALERSARRALPRRQARRARDDRHRAWSSTVRGGDDDSGARRRDLAGDRGARAGHVEAGARADAAAVARGGAARGGGDRRT